MCRGFRRSISAQRSGNASVIKEFVLPSYKYKLPSMVNTKQVSAVCKMLQMQDENAALCLGVPSAGSRRTSSEKQPKASRGSPSVFLKSAKMDTGLPAMIVALNCRKCFSDKTYGVLHSFRRKKDDRSASPFASTDWAD